MHSEQKTYRIELLAPAKNLETGRVAIEAGADAVYIGGPSFGARKAAGNSLEDLAALCRYAHLFGAKVLVTLNTLLREEEMREAVRLAYAYKKIGADGIIIQDLRLANILFESGDFPRWNEADAEQRAGKKGHYTWLHASTQCDNRTVERVQELEAMGFRRVVLARELSYEEMRRIREQTGCELEAFVHGALCVSYSGACYLSEAVCGRSANRGECAQMCRLAYDVLDEQGKELLHQKHILSLRDLDRSGHLRELIETGITTLKIEGRLKDADYVRNIVGYYRSLLNRMPEVEPSSRGICRRSFVPNPEKTFHRGATDYFSFGRPESLVNQDTPKSTGELLGIAPLSAETLATIHNGDGITYEGEGFYWPNPRVRIPAGAEVYRNLDTAFLKSLHAPGACSRVLPVRIRFEETEEGFALTMEEAGENRPKAKGERREARVECRIQKEPAQHVERAEAMVRQQLQKLGGTPLEAEEIEICWKQPLFLPAATLNDARRRLVDTFLQADRESVETDTLARPCFPERVEEALRQPLTPLPPMPDEWMTCKYCILNELGQCKQRNPQKTGVPTYLRQGGTLLRIVTDCGKCEMKLKPLSPGSRLFGHY